MKVVASVDWRESQDMPLRELYQVPQAVTGLHRVTVVTSMIGNSGGLRPFIEWYGADNSLLRRVYLGVENAPVNVVNNTAVVFPRPGTAISLGVDLHSPLDAHYLVMAAVESFTESAEAQKMHEEDLVFLGAASIMPGVGTGSLNLKIKESIRESRMLGAALGVSSISPADAKAEESEPESKNKEEEKTR